MLLAISVSIVFSVILQAQSNENQISIPDSTIILSKIGNSLQLNHEQIQSLPFRNLSSYGLVAPSAYRLKGNRMFYYGIESTRNHTFIDGMQIADASSFPVRLIQSYSLYTTQAPINMGFTSGGITAIETLNQLTDFTILFDVSYDQAYDAQGINGEMLINIPFSSAKNKTSNKKAPSLLIAGKYSWTNNTDPVWKRTQKLNSETLAELTTNPIRPPFTYGVVEQNAEYVTSVDMMSQKVPDNSGKTGIYPFVKLNLPVSKNINLNIGNYSVIDEAEIYNNANALFNTAGNATRSRQNFDTYVNWNHNIEINENLTLNYDFNFQYSNYYFKIRDKRHEDRFFDYGYVGKFTTYKMPTYELGSDSVDGQYYKNVWVLNSWDYDTLVTYEPSNINPGLSAYTSDYYDIYSGQPTGHYRNINDLTMGGGRINGMASPTVYGLYNNTGNVTAGYQESSFEKIRATFQMKADYKSQHFTIGGEYNRESQRHFSISPNGLWNLIRDGRGLTNFHLRQLDKDNPILLTYNGHADTIQYYRKYDANAQREFDKNLRIALGLPIDGLDYIVTDSYDRERNTIDYYDKYGNMHTINTPENFWSLDMFSEQELLNNGHSMINYAGYSYTGKKQKGNIDPYSFFENFTIAAAKPKYWSVFIQDEFELKNLRVRLGLRMDVYNANRPVLRDVYSLYPIYNAKEATALSELVFDKPDNIGDDYFVYVDKIHDPAKVVGYRNGHSWFNGDGIEILDPTILDVGNGISPYLIEPDIHSFENENWTPSMTFQDYSQTVNLLPQISIDYTIIKRLNIYTNYSSFTSNPTYFSDFRPEQYYFFNYYSQSQIMSNPALKPMRAGKFFTGIKAIIWKNIVADASYIYTTIDNLVSTKKFVGAYPNDYTVIANKEEGISTQGFEVTLEMVNQLVSGLNGSISYTRLFPKHDRFINNYISNMVINADLSYQFGRGSNFAGPSWFNEKLFQGFSASIYYQHRNGLPYMATSNNYFYEGVAYTPNINIFNVNIQKGFMIGNKTMMNVYLIIENLFNFKNVFKVYSDTGLPDDDGFLSDPQWQNQINNQLNPDSYRLLYQLKLYNPQFYDIPRIWRIGVIFRY